MLRGDYLIDANISFDQDAKFGGGIVSFEYSIDGKKFKTDRPSIKWIFETAGEHIVGVKVEDSDGATNEYSVKIDVK